MLQCEQLKTILEGRHGGYSPLPRDCCDSFGAGCPEGEVCCRAARASYEYSYSARP